MKEMFGLAKIEVWLVEGGLDRGGIPLSLMTLLYKKSYLSRKESWIIGSPEDFAVPEGS